jgi:hypothetical protein
MGHGRSGIDGAELEGSATASPSDGFFAIRRLAALPPAMGAAPPSQAALFVALSQGQ